METTIAGVVGGLLGVEKVGVNDNFFELGFDSLLAHRMIGRLEEPLGITLPLRVLLEIPTVAQLAQFAAAVAPKR